MIVVFTLGVVPGAPGSHPFAVAAAVIADTNRSRSAEPAPATSRVKMDRDAICVVLPYAMSLSVGSPSRRVTPALASVSRKALVLSADKLIDTDGVTAPELPTMTGNRESEV